VGFRVTNISEEIDKRKVESLGFEEELKNSRDEYGLIEEMTSLRKQHKLTQRQLVNMTGNRKQCILGMKNKGISISLGGFCNMLNVMGYELKIVKRE
jgi:hypothetical protein